MEGRMEENQGRDLRKEGRKEGRNFVVLSTTFRLRKEGRKKGRQESRKG
jgi:hypothetical protein